LFVGRQRRGLEDAVKQPLGGDGVAPVVKGGRRSTLRSRKWWCTAAAKPRVSVAVAQPNASELRSRVVVTPSTVIDTDSGARTSAERPAP
jgi:hypothetical protein